MKSYYNAKDIEEIIECGKTKAYEIIKQLREKFENEYPDAIPIQGRIPIWYFEKIMMNKERGDHNETKEVG